VDILSETKLNEEWMRELENIWESEFLHHWEWTNE
jgi:hypothetical protein